MQLNLSVAIILFIASLFVTLQSPFAPFASHIPGVDIGVFINCAKQILDGSLMYKDVFDHKGPALYLYYILGLKLFKGNLVGLWVLELLFLYVTSIILFFISTLVANKKISLIAVMYSLLLLSSLLGNGGHVREVALPFICLSLYLYAKALLNSQTPGKYETAFIAFSCASTFLLLPNMITLWIGFSIVILYQSFLRKEYREIAIHMLVFAFMCAITLLPFIVYAVYTNTISDAIFCVWDFNKAYSNTSLIKMLNGIRHTIVNLDKGYASVFVLAYVLYLYHQRKGLMNLNLHIAICISFVLTVVLGCSLSGQDDSPYFIICIPLICIIVTYVLHLISMYSKLSTASIFVIVMLYSWRTVSGHARYVLSAYRSDTNITEAVKTIKNSTDAKDKIAVMGCSSYLYILSDRISMSKYNFTVPIFNVKPYGVTFLNQYCNELKSKKPKMILIETAFYQTIPASVSDIIKNNYLVMSINNTKYSFYIRKHDT